MQASMQHLVKYNLPNEASLSVTILEHLVANPTTIMFFPLYIILFFFFLSGAVYWLVLMLT